MRRAFRFRLARVLRVRRVTERTAKNEWAAAESDSKRASDATDDARERVRGAGRELAEIQAAGELLAGDVLAGDQALESLRGAVVRRRAEALRLGEVAEELRGVWSERRRDTRALERLEERQLERHRIELRRAEDAEIDEWAAGRRTASPSPERMP